MWDREGVEDFLPASHASWAKAGRPVERVRCRSFGSSTGRAAAAERANANFDGNARQARGGGRQRSGGQVIK